MVAAAPKGEPLLESRDSAYCKQRGFMAPKPKVAGYSLPPCRSSLDCVRKRPGICELILSCHSTAFFLFPSQYSVFFLLSYRNIFSLLSFRPVFLSVTPACFFICHSGLRAGVQVNIASISAWIPGQARNDSKKTSPE